MRVKRADLVTPTNSDETSGHFRRLRGDFSPRAGWFLLGGRQGREGTVKRQAMDIEYRTRHIRQKFLVNQTLSAACMTRCHYPQ